MQNLFVPFQTIEFCDADPSFNLEIPSSYHGKWKVKENILAFH